MLSLDAEVGAGVEYLAADTAGKDEAQPVFQSVFEHITDYQCDKERQGEVAITLLEEER